MYMKLLSPIKSKYLPARAIGITRFTERLMITIALFWGRIAFSFSLVSILKSEKNFDLYLYSLDKNR